MSRHRRKQYLEERREQTRQALLGLPFSWPAEGDVVVVFGRPRLARQHSTDGARLVVGVPADWLETVHIQGLARIEGYLCLQALPVAAPEGADGAWQVWLAWAGSGSVTTSHPASQTHAVSWGGLVRLDVTVAKAHSNCVEALRRILAGEVIPF